MANLNDTQRVLLSHAAKQANGSFYPLPAQLADLGAFARVRRAFAMLGKLRLIEERETNDAGAVHRSDCDVRYGLFITTAGLAAIGITDPADLITQATAPAPATAPSSKTAIVVDLLSREAGATTAELIDATGWLPHSTRAALTGLRKKGHVIKRSNRDDATCYRIVAAA